MDPRAIRVAARVVAECERGTRPLDAALAHAFREAKGLDDDARGDVVRVVSRVLKRRALYDDALARLPFEVRREGLVLAALVDEGARTPLPRPDTAALEDALARAKEAARDDDARVALESPMPRAVVDAIAAQRGREVALAVARAAGSDAPLTLRANTLVTTREALVERLADEGHRAHATARSPLGVVVDERAPIRRTRAFGEGHFELQDEGSQLVALAAGAKPGMVVVDACAGAGGKTLALAAAMENAGTLHAFDVHTRRLDELRVRARRAHVHNVRVHALDEAGRRVQKRLAGAADVVLVDAPCSGSGTLRRAPDLARKLSLQSLPDLVDTQREILARAAALVAPGGRLVYATCSLLEDENEGVVRRFLDENAQFTPTTLGIEGVDEGALGATLWPHELDTDGFFVAALVRA